MAKNDLLLNGKLGAPLVPWRGDDAVLVPAGWSAWWLQAPQNAPDWQMQPPLFGAATLDGVQTQSLATPYGTHVAGLWQQVPSAESNKVEFEVECQAWSSDGATPGSQMEPTDVNVQVGIDPTGGLDPESPLIIWSDPIQPISHWETARVSAEAQARVITVYTKSAPIAPKRQQRVFWRNAFLRPIGRHKRAVNIVGVGDTHGKPN